MLTVDGHDFPMLHDQTTDSHLRQSLSRKSSWSESDGSCSPISVASDRSKGHSRGPSYDSLELSDDGRGEAVPLRSRGPWDHSASIKIPFDVSAVLTPPMPAVVNVSIAR